MEEKRAGRDALSALPGPTLRIGNALAYAVLIGVKAASKAGLLGDETKQAVDTPLTPASWAFGVWVLLFVLQGAGVAYQLLPNSFQPDGTTQRIVNSIGFGWQAGLLCEAALQLTALRQTHLGTLACLLSVLAALLSFAWTLSRLYRLKDLHGPLSSIWLYAVYFLPTSISTAWLSVLSAMAALSLAADYRVPVNLEAAAVTAAVCVTLLGIYVVHRFRDSAYGLTLIASLVAIYGRQTAAPLRVASLLCLAVLFLFTLVTVLRRKQPHPQSELADLRQPLSRDRGTEDA